MWRWPPTHLEPRLKKEYNYTSIPLRAYVACCTVNFTFTFIYTHNGVHGGAVDWGTALQTGMSRVQFPIVSLKISLTQSFRPNCGHGIDSSSKRNEYQEYFLEGKGGRCLGLTTLPPSCADCHEIWQPEPPGTLRACPGLYRDCFTFYLYLYLHVTPKFRHLEG